MSAGDQLVEVNGAELCVESFGDAADPAILLVAGASASMLWWDAELCERIAAAGRFVIRYDARDTGRSVSYPPGQPGYSLADLVQDALGILDTVGVERAHFVCQSMFGGLGLVVAVDHPDRMATLTLVSTSTGDEQLPPPAEYFTEHAPPEPDLADTAAVIDYVVRSMKAISGGSAHFDEAEARELVERDVARARDYASTLANHYAMVSDKPVNGGFEDITAPTLVVHGDLDPLLPLAHGEALRDAIPAAELLVLRGAGHDLPRPTWDAFVAGVVRHTESPSPGTR
ncbi:alpha/beta hydrolase [Actinosynnema sp. ALI-1.44]|uniref:alpha/beta fold hydrolase n=1 Tax=Actinosynnema sp. ALI-1.44 TaxID=1933779 RepID=UPI00097BEE7A|nr:alpha/beta hydrolase [Actinosynnema sp. ALI-1.44]ONI76094.1 alpha/beta hydrolase [Actinosynnema sp. ALI-1.44]